MVFVQGVVENKMPNNTLTLALSGEVPFATFATAITRFRELVDALTAELGVASEVEWIVDDLHIGSTIATIRGEANEPEHVERVVRAYASVGHALEFNQPIPFSDKVAMPARGLTRVLSEKVTTVRFETPETDATVSATTSRAPRTQVSTALGAIEGRVQTLTSRHGLRFNLYDTLHDRVVSCYLQDGQQDIMREAWDKRASVEGTVSREVFTGRPIAVRQIIKVSVLQENEPGSYLKARNVAPLKAGEAMPEEVIRRLRDA